MNGELIVDFILWIASVLRDRGAPGWFSLGIVFVWLFLSAWYQRATMRFCTAVNQTLSLFPASPEEKITNQSLLDIDRELAISRSNQDVPRTLANAWNEFRETTVDPTDSSHPPRNTVRPSNFFNLLDLGVDSGWWRQVPAMFISVGLFLTFLGLVAALDQTAQVLVSSSAGSANTTSGLTTLLTVASAKFIMSLTGLLCSILFTLQLKWSERAKDKILHALCIKIEEGFVFLSEQDILREMKEIAEEQSVHLQKFSTELVAQIARPLREDLPEAIRVAIETTLAPAMETFSRDAGKSIETLTGAVGDKIAGGVQSAADSINDSVVKTSHAFETIADRLDRSSQDVTRNINTASDHMVSDITAATANLREKLQEPLSDLVHKVEVLARNIDVATGKVYRYSDSIDSSTNSVVAGNEALSQSTQTLISAIRPIRDTLADILKATSNMSDGMEEASKAVVNGAKSTTNATVGAVESMRDSVDRTQDTINQSFASLLTAIEEFNNTLGRYREIDSSLGRAFQSIEDEVKKSISAMSDYQEKLSNELGSALQKLESVIAQAEQFVPRKRVSN